MLSFDKNDMNKFRLIGFGCCLILLYSLYSCKKDSSTPAKRVITYKLTSSNYTLFTNIAYTDTIGVQEVASAADSTSGWSKTISESYTGFTVLLQTQGQNSSSSELTYTLEIIADGVSKAKQDYSTPAFSSFNSQISTIIQ